MPAGDESALNRPVRALMFEVGPGFRPSNCFWHRRSRRAKCDACPLVNRGISHGSPRNESLHGDTLRPPHVSLASLEIFAFEKVS